MQPLRERMSDKCMSDAPIDLRPTVVIEDSFHPRVEDDHASAIGTIAVALVDQRPAVRVGALRELNGGRF